MPAATGHLPLRPPSPKPLLLRRSIGASSAVPGGAAPKGPTFNPLLLASVALATQALRTAGHPEQLTSSVNDALICLRQLSQPPAPQLLRSQQLRARNSSFFDFGSSNASRLPLPRAFSAPDGAYHPAMSPWRIFSLTCGLPPAAGGALPGAVALFSSGPPAGCAGEGLPLARGALRAGSGLLMLAQDLQGISADGGGNSSDGGGGSIAGNSSVFSHLLLAGGEPVSQAASELGTVLLLVLRQVSFVMQLGASSAVGGVGDAATSLAGIMRPDNSTVLADAAGGSAPAWPGLPAMPQMPVAPEMAGWLSAILWILAILAVYVGIGLGAATRTRNPSHTRLELE